MKRISIIILEVIIFLLTGTLYADIVTNHLVISEIGYVGNDGIIELYNPTGTDIDLSAVPYEIDRFSGGGGTKTSVKLSSTDGDGYFRNTSIISSHKYFLIVDRAISSLTNIADFIITNGCVVNDDDAIALGDGTITILGGGPDDPDCIDWVGYGAATVYEGTGAAPNPPSGGSIERKAWAAASTASMTNGGADEFHGNAYDSSNNQNDFVVRYSADWQNTTSTTESPYLNYPETLISSLNGVVPTTVVYPGETNVTLLTFNLTETYTNRTLTQIQVSNIGSMNYPDDYNVLKLWYDNDKSKDYSVGDTLVAELHYKGSYIWTNNNITTSSDLGVIDGRNFILTANISSSPTAGRIMRSIIKVGWLRCSSGKTNISTLENPDDIIIKPSLNVVINEIAWAGTLASTSDEWLELYNNTGSDIDLTGWGIYKDNGDTLLIGLSGTINAKGFYLIERTDDLTVRDINGDVVGSFGGSGLGNSGEFLIVKDSLGNIIDLIDCSSGWFAGSSSGNMPTMERVHSDLDGNINTNWKTNNQIIINGKDANLDAIYGTPGTYNSVTSTPFEVLRIVGYDTLKLNVFPEDTYKTAFAFRLSDNIAGKKLSSVKITNMGTMVYGRDYNNVRLFLDVNGDHIYTKNVDIYITDFSYNSVSGLLEANNITFSSNLDSPGRDFVITIDITSFPVESTSFQVRIPAGYVESDTTNTLVGTLNKNYLKIFKIPRVAINEIEWKGSLDGDYYEEWIELYNNSDTAIDLSGWQLSAADGSPVISLSGTIPAKGFYLLERSDDNVVSDIPGDYVGSFGTGIGNSGEDFMLINSDGAVEDEVNFSSGWPYALNYGVSMERKDSEANGSIAANWMTNNHLVFNGTNKGVNIWYATPKSTNSCRVEPNKIFVTKADIGTSTNYPLNINIPVMCLHVSNTALTDITLIRVKNTGTMNIDSDISNIKLWYDAGDNIFNGNETIIGIGVFNGNIWEFTNHVKPVTNLIITIDLKQTAKNGRYFRSVLPLYGIKDDIDTVSRYSLTNLYIQTVKRLAPAVNSLKTNIDSGKTVVTNNNTDSFDISANIIELSNSGIYAVMDLSSIGHGLQIMNRLNITNYALSNITVPANVRLGSKPLVLYAYESTTNLVTVATTYIQVTGNEPPYIKSVSVDNANIIKNSKGEFFKSGTSVKLSYINFTVSATDSTDYVDKVFILLSQMNGGTNQMSLFQGTSNNGIWAYSFTLNSSLHSGFFTNITIVSDNKSGYYYTNFPVINIMSNKFPIANAGKDVNASGNTIFTLDGSKSYDPEGLSLNYKWEIVTNHTGKDLTILNSNKSTASVELPNIDSYIIVKLTVTDIYGDSASDTVTININRSFREDLTAAHPYNTVISPDKKSAKFVNLSEGTVITIYTITGNKVAVITADTDEAEWQIPEYLAAGVYIVYMEDKAGHTKKMKIVIVR